MILSLAHRKNMRCLSPEGDVYLDHVDREPWGRWSNSFPDLEYGPVWEWQQVIQESIWRLRP